MYLLCIDVALVGVIFLVSRMVLATCIGCVWMQVTHAQNSFCSGVNVPGGRDDVT